MSTSQNEIILITGGNTGLGYHTAASLIESSNPVTIIITSRSLNNATKAAESLNQLAASGSVAVPMQLDVDDDGSINDLYRDITSKYGKLDVLINNAGVSMDLDVMAGKVSARDAFMKTYSTNVVSAHILTSTFIPLLLLSTNPRIVFISSSVASLAAQTNEAFPINQAPPAGWPKQPSFTITSYRTSKTAMNMMILEWIRVLKHDGVKVHCVDPGFLATGLGGQGADLLRQYGASDPKEGGDFVKDVVVGARDEDIGKLVTKGGVVPW